MRNFYCPEYFKCLTLHAKQNDIDFECKGCRYEKAIRDDRKFSEIEGIFLLMLAIFQPDFFKQIQEIEQKKFLLTLSQTKGENHRE
jgi:hypothetical protein